MMQPRYNRYTLSRVYTFYVRTTASWLFLICSCIDFSACKDRRKERMNQDADIYNREITTSLENAACDSIRIDVKNGVSVEDSLARISAHPISPMNANADMWDRPLKFTIKNGTIFIISAGNDGHFHSPDDIVKECRMSDMSQQ